MRTLRNRYRWVLVLILLIVVVQNGFVLAVNQENQKIDLHYDEPQPKETTSMAGMMLRLVLSLVFIIALAWIIIQVFGRQMARKIQGQWVQVLDEVMLGQNRGIVLCEVGGKVYAIGVTDHQITTLFEVKDEELIGDMIKQAYQGDRGIPLAGTSTWWERVRGYFPPKETKKPNRHFHTLMQQQIQDLDQMARRRPGSGRERNGDD